MRFNLIKREPSYFFENIHEDLERFLKETFGELEPVTVDNKPFERRFRPAVEVSENNNEYKIDVELTGAKKDDVCVELTEDSVMINAEIKYEKKEDNDNLHYTEFRYGKFTRTIPLSHKIDTEKSACEYKDGILHIKLTKKEPETKKTTKKLTVN